MIRPTVRHFHGKNNFAKTKFAYVAEKLLTEVACEILDLLNAVPDENPCDMLRQTILHLTGESEVKKLSNLFSNVSI